MTLLASYAHLPLGPPTRICTRPVSLAAKSVARLRARLANRSGKRHKGFVHGTHSASMQCMQRTCPRYEIFNDSDGVLELRPAFGRMDNGSRAQCGVA